MEQQKMEMPEIESAPPAKLKLWQIPELWFGSLFLLWMLCTFVLIPLQQNPDFLKPLLPQTLYAVWEEFAVMKLEAPLRISSLVCGFLSLISLSTRGWTWQSRIGMFVIWCIMAFLWFGAVFIAAKSVRERGSRLDCSTNLLRIYQASLQYTADNAGFFPPNLEVLEKQPSETPLDRETLHCPSLRKAEKEFTDFIYYGAGRKLSDPPFLLLQDRDGNHPGIYCNNIFSDGRITRGPREQAEQ